MSILYKGTALCIQRELGQQSSVNHHSGLLKNKNKTNKKKIPVYHYITKHATELEKNLNKLIMTTLHPTEAAQYC